MPTSPLKPDANDFSDRTARIETKLDGLIESVAVFTNSTERRFITVESQLRESGRWSFSAISTIALIIGMICAACAAYVSMRIAPIEAAQNTSTAERASLGSNLNRMEEDRHRDNSELDDRLQREMRLVSDIVKAQGDSTKEVLIRDEKRLDDVIGRVDRLHESDRRELSTYREMMAKKVVGQ